MKELAIVQLTKSLLGKVNKKIADKKEKWKQEAALSVEETKRREEEFKEDFLNLKKATKPNASANLSQAHKHERTETKKTALAEVPVAAKAIEKDSAKETKADTKNTQKSPDTKKAAKTVSKKKETTDTKEKTTKSSAKDTNKNTKQTQTSKKSEAKTKTPSKREEKLALYSKDITKHYGEVDEAFLGIVVKNLGPSIYRKDAELVSCSDPKELDTVRKNFLIKKLEMKENDDVLNAAIKEVCEELKASRNKYRATFYYALAKKFNLESKLS